MPGVPSSKGCGACRKQKKKCDQANPCSRCARLGIRCIGAGQQRYVFHTQTKTLDSSKSKLSTPNLTIARTYSEITNPAPDQTVLFQNRWNVVADLLCTPVNGGNKLFNAFVYAIQPSMDVRFNLGWTYGIYFYEIPQRLGTSKPLDTAVAALILAHSEVCRRFRQVSVKTLMKYSDALSTLRSCLNDPVEASRPETLCAVSILLICQSLLGIQRSDTPTHGEGAARIIQARGYSYNPKDSLEQKLLLTLRGSLLFDGIFNDKVSNMFTLEQWQFIVKNELDGSTSEGEMMRCVAQIPDIIRRGRYMRKNGISDDKIVQQCQSGYRTIKSILENVQKAYEEVNKSHVKSSSTTVSLHAYYQRLYGVTMIFAAISNLLLQAVLTYNSNPAIMSIGPVQQHPSSDLDIEGLVSEASQYSNKIYQLSAEANQYRPLGGAYMLTCLMAAWIIIDDPYRQRAIQLAIDDYQGDYTWTNLKITAPVLNWMKRRLHFEDLPSYVPDE